MMKCHPWAGFFEPTTAELEARAQDAERTAAEAGTVKFIIIISNASNFFFHHTINDLRLYFTFKKGKLVFHFQRFSPLGERIVDVFVLLGY